ncbi:MAG: cupredoxin domain-containing protein [Candidatus Yonathbacteria bacterium]|nr:cupredoxin domain-containing protein [Candidatus Yonathbacteria bacterium]
MNTSNNTIVIILVGTIVILGGYLIFGNSPTSKNEVASPEATTTGVTATTQTKTAPKTTTATKTTSVQKVTVPTMTKDGLYVIYYTNTGFSPATLRIVKGKGVRFINNSDKAMRIFADQKYDNVYSALNQSKTVGRGVTYDFVFNEAGNWAYHNENNQNDRGTVIVAEK